ncbi:MAG: aspartyl/glutamyl-tRNA amidotransferase subunit A [Candidatus Liptonbacteria bacterium GWC1_60_9]|uniref:Glutamyl-tRNA(Gln) amidotransferase subunit A n=3 Tax=Candidatus Liptoniibacteriota TaxID=1817909 RepID=A0A1G2CJG5_9BACT|nr:MAG: Glutamyl-tRNA(Gln) amidotransferase subunit A [Parcubacteria group bacterium GW2011_GWA1_60_11]OGY96901.1 MAG: aspartyl/glutamyl-tRNA amidotransferase subunit A [Candidatus Liptonbacteria bacterium GWC1_60_9]OGZ00077.1 MAG: aspartyl/glutamyl-tRNA amidotransferase subunit A [Candidatus Liptonbacteria bacterium RIFCSPHIGHO2_12_FULL_60_13]OGZ01544.1 MAG: aspartyl/glutamyl-tRNA amidotransferase subunit A [Candidatus Liptonbacteria bacterium RIFCSPLOWO2_12_FULL_60_15]
MHLHDLTISTIREGLLGKKFSALELAQAHFKFIREKDRSIGAFLSLNEEEALRAAEETDLAIAKDEPVPPLSGVPVALKDNMLMEGGITTAGSRILETYRGAYDATVVRKLRDAKAVIIGKTNLDEFAMGSSTESSAFQRTVNPHDPERVPGGSSGGSAAAVAAHMAVVALGSDTGGSIRQPASLCGVVGMKPTYGSVSRYGLIAMSSSLDQIGPFAKTVEDAALLYDAIKGYDPHDATSLPAGRQASQAEPSFEELRKLTIGLPEEYFAGGLEPETEAAVAAAIERFKGLGVAMKKISLPHTNYALSCYYIIMPAEVSANLARFDGIRYGTRPSKAENLLDIYTKARGDGFGLEVQRRIILGTFVLSSGYYDAYYAKAQKVRTLIARDFENAWKEVDVILTPVSPTRAFKFGEKTDDPLKMYLSDIFTIPVNLAGLPGISIPADRSLPLPVGFQLIGRPFREADILGLGKLYERL